MPVTTTGTRNLNTEIAAGTGGLVNDGTTNTGPTGSGAEVSGRGGTVITNRLEIRNGGTMNTSFITYNIGQTVGTSDNDTFTLTEGTMDVPNCNFIIGGAGVISGRLGASRPTRTGNGLSGDWSNTYWTAVTPVNFNFGSENPTNQINEAGAVYEGSLVHQRIPGKQYPGVNFATGFAQQGGVAYNYRIINITAGDPNSTGVNAFWQCDLTDWLAPGFNGNTTDTSGNANQALNLNPAGGYNQTFLLANPQATVGGDSVPLSMATPILSFGWRGNPRSGQTTMRVLVMQAWNPVFTNSTTLTASTDIRMEAVPDENGDVNFDIRRKLDTFSSSTLQGTIDGVFNSGLTGFTGFLLSNGDMSLSGATGTERTGSIATLITDRSFRVFSNIQETYNTQNGNVLTVTSQSDDCSLIHGGFTEEHSLPYPSSTFFNAFSGTQDQRTALATAAITNLDDLAAAIQDEAYNRLGTDSSGDTIRIPALMRSASPDGSFINWHVPTVTLSNSDGLVSPDDDMVRTQTSIIDEVGTGMMDDLTIGEDFLGMAGTALDLSNQPVDYNLRFTNVSNPRVLTGTAASIRASDAFTFSNTAFSGATTITVTPTTAGFLRFSNCTGLNNVTLVNATAGTELTLLDATMSQFRAVMGDIIDEPTPPITVTVHTMDIPMGVAWDILHGSIRVDGVGPQANIVFSSAGTGNRLLTLGTPVRLIFSGRDINGRINSVTATSSSTDLDLRYENQTPILNIPTDTVSSASSITIIGYSSTDRTVAIEMGGFTPGSDDAVNFTGLTNLVATSRGTQPYATAITDFIRDTNNNVTLPANGGVDFDLYRANAFGPDFVRSRCFFRDVSMNIRILPGAQAVRDDFSTLGLTQAQLSDPQTTVDTDGDVQVVFTPRIAERTVQTNNEQTIIDAINTRGRRTALGIP